MTDIVKAAVVTLERRGHVLMMGLNRPEKRNAFNAELNAMRWLLTGEEYDAHEAHRIGLVQEVTEPGKQLARATEIAEAIATRSAPLGVRTTLESAHRALVEGDAAAAARLTPDMVALLRTADGGEGMMSFIERRPANFTGTVREARACTGRPSRPVIGVILDRPLWVMHQPLSSAIGGSPGVKRFERRMAV